MIRAVVDLNVIISALIVSRGAPHAVWSAWQADRFTLLVSEGMLVELAGKLAEPRIARKYGITADHAHATATLLRTQGSLVPVPEGRIGTVTGDPEDDLVLATAHLGHADYLVTGDRKLLDLATSRGVAIVAPRAFLEVLAREAP